MSRLFGTDGVRGIANKELTPEIAYNLGKAACEALKAKEEAPLFVIGTDTRISCDMLKFSLCSGIMSRGGNVLDAGIVPTPAVAMLIRHFKASSGVVISASHNPFYDNGIKFFNENGEKLSDETEDGIQHIFETSGYSELYICEKIGRYSMIADAGEIYAQSTIEAFPNFSLKGKKVVMDCANGATSKIAPEVFKKLGADVICINSEPNGLNINDECGSTHTRAMRLSVIDNNADFGLAFDGDADRLIASDENGNEINGDMLMYLFAIHLKRQALLYKDTLVITVMSNLGLKLLLQKNGVNIKETAVGDRYILEAMQKEGFTLGGEQSGHIINAQINSTGDGLASALMLSYLISSNKQTLSEMLCEFVNYPQVLVNVKTENTKKLKYTTSPEVQSELIRLNDKYKGTGRVLLRHSGTEPLVRVMIEGVDIDEITKDANSLADVIRKISE